MRLVRTSNDHEESRDGIVGLNAALGEVIYYTCPAYERPRAD